MCFASLVSQVSKWHKQIFCLYLDAYWGSRKWTKRKDNKLWRIATFLFRMRKIGTYTDRIPIRPGLHVLSFTDSAYAQPSFTSTLVSKGHGVARRKAWQRRSANTALSTASKRNKWDPVKLPCREKRANMCNNYVSLRPATSVRNVGGLWLGDKICRTVC